MGIFVMTQRRIYQEEFPYFVTLRTQDGYSLFEDEKMAGLLSEIIFNAGRLKQYDILAYQIMPDHVHVLIYNQYPRAQASLPAIVYLNDCAPAEGCARRDFNVSQLIHSIKSYYCDQIRDKYRINYPIWQKRFYTRIVNNRRYLHAVIGYIKNNPIKAKLPNKYNKMPYQYFDWPKIH
jgi:REP element-mobilizing transposase RayT